MIIKQLYICVLFIIFLVIIHYSFDVCDNKTTCIKYSQILGDPNSNTFIRSIISSHIHMNIDHLITNCVSFIVISFFLIDFIFFYFFS